MPVTVNAMGNVPVRAELEDSQVLLGSTVYRGEWQGAVERGLEMNPLPTPTMGGHMGV